MQFIIHISVSSSLYVKIGTKGNAQILDGRKLYENLGLSVAKALPVLHVFTGCDYTSAFHVIDKVKAFKLLKKSQVFQHAFGEIGGTHDIDTDHFKVIQEFVYLMYGVKSISSVNDAPYKKICGNKGKLF